MSQDPYDDELPQPAWKGLPMPEDARSIGLDRNTVEGAWLELASNLDRRKRSHLVVAVLLLAVFLLPVLSQLSYLIDLL